MKTNKFILFISAGLNIIFNIRPTAIDNITILDSDIQFSIEQVKLYNATNKVPKINTLKLYMQVHFDHKIHSKLEL